MYFKHIKVLWSLFHRFFSLFFFLGVNRVKLLDIWYILGFEGKISGGHRALHLHPSATFLNVDIGVWFGCIWNPPYNFIYIYQIQCLPLSQLCTCTTYSKTPQWYFLCHSILHVALHKHFVLTNGHVLFFLDNFNSRLFVYYKILLLFYLYRTGFFFFFLIWIKSLYPWPDTCTRWLVQH